MPKPPVMIIAVERDDGARLKGLLDDAQSRRFALGQALWQAEPPLPVVWLNENGLVDGFDGQAGYASTLYQSILRATKTGLRSVEHLHVYREEIGQFCGMPPKWFDAALQRLEAAGLIERPAHGGLALGPRIHASSFSMRIGNGLSAEKIEARVQRLNAIKRAELQLRALKATPL